MQKWSFVSSLAVLLLSTLLPQPASAKAPTVKITISGGSLTRAFDVTDPQILDISHAWGETFLDQSRQPLDEAPQGGRPYEVSFYSLIADELRKTCVVYYYPGAAADQGLVYLPGKGAVWGLNVGTVLREGRDGKWNYAFPRWDALMKAAISRAETTAQPHGPREATSRISIDGWTKPRKGWLYVLDPQSKSGGDGSRIWLLDPETGKAMGSIRAGYQPDMALSPDGARLYIVSGERETGELAVIDTGHGTVQHVPFPDRILYTPWYARLPPFTSMTLSSDGKALRILGQRTFPPEKAESQVFTFDTLTGRFLPTTLNIGTCGDLANFVPASTAGQFDVLCDWDNTLHSVRLDSAYRETSNTVVKLPGEAHCPAAAGFMMADKNRLALIRHDGTIDEMDRATQSFRPTEVTGKCAPPWVVSSLNWPRSPDGAKVYVGYGPPTPNNLATSERIKVFDTANWKQLGAVQTSAPFWSAAASEDGTIIYAMVPEQHRILVIDATTLEEKRVVGVGKRPAAAIVSP